MTQVESEVVVESVTIRAEVLKAFDEYVRAWQDADLPALSQIYANDDQITAIWPDPTIKYPLIGWTAVRAGLKDALRRCRGMRVLYHNHVVHCANDMAVLTAEWKWLDLDQPNKPGAIPTGRMARTELAIGHGTFVFERRDRKWVVVHEHSAGSPGLHRLSGHSNANASI